jgi:LysR family transcriptional regulator, transcriptional activator of nhaA
LPTVLGEFEDYALLQAFGETGTGVFPMPAIFQNQIRRRKRLKVIGITRDVQLQFYAISAERKLQHPAVIALRNAARHELFRDSGS